MKEIMMKIKKKYSSPVAEIVDTEFLPVLTTLSVEYGEGDEDEEYIPPGGFDGTAKEYQGSWSDIWNAM